MKFSFGTGIERLSEFAGRSNVGVSSGGVSFVSPNGERNLSDGGVVLLPLFVVLLFPEDGS